MKSGALLAALTLCFTSFAVYAQTQYTVTDIGSYHLDTRNPFEGPSIAPNGHVAMTIVRPAADSASYAALYSDGRRNPLDGSSSFGSQALGVNEHDAVVITSGHSPGLQAYVWQGGEMKNLGTLGGSWSKARAINGSGQIVGTSTLADARMVAFLYTGGVMTRIGTQWGSAMAINQSGQVTGVYDFKGRCSGAFLYSAGELRQLSPLPAGCAAHGYAINDAGHVVGDSSAYKRYHATLFKEGATIDLGTLGTDRDSFAFGINNAGDIVGTSTPNQIKKSWNLARAFIYRDGKMTALDSLLEPASGQGWRLCIASSINEAGQIVGWGHLNGRKRQFLLTPTTH